MTIRIIGANPHGFKNEELLAYELNDKKIADLPVNLKKFVEYICAQEKIDVTGQEIVKSKKIKGQAKADIFVEIKDKKFGVSVKMGSGNSVHQEKIESFIDWAKHNTDLSDEVANDLRLLIWADGTLDGTLQIKKDKDGNVIGRFGTKGFIERYSESFERLSNYFEKNKEAIIIRALFDGKNQYPAKYLYKGTITDGKCISREEYIKHFVTGKSSKIKDRLMCGSLSYQAYNAALKATSQSEKKRGDIQFKYGDMSRDFDYYYRMINIPINIGTREGDSEEYSFTRIMNKNHGSAYWTMLKKSIELTPNRYHYVVNVKGKKFSSNAKKKVSCKSDAFVIETQEEIDRNLLLQNEYSITEEHLKLISNYQVVPNSGISVKRRDSTSYTITKMTIQNFRTAFLPYIDNIDFYIAGIVLYCTKQNVELNVKIATDLGINVDDFLSYFAEEHHISAETLLDYENLAKISSVSKLKIKEILEANDILRDMVFKGKGWFDDPYHINFIFTDNQLSNNVFVPFYVDNGSGRSKGEYYIIFKPL